MEIIGESKFSGSVVATAFTGDGSGLTGLLNDSLFSGVSAGLGTGILTNSNSNFGQLSLVADGFRKEAFAKDNKG